MTEVSYIVKRSQNDYKKYFIMFVFEHPLCDGTTSVCVSIYKRNAELQLLDDHRCIHLINVTTTLTDWPNNTEHVHCLFHTTPTLFTHHTDFTPSDAI